MKESEARPEEESAGTIQSRPNTVKKLLVSGSALIVLAFCGVWVFNYFTIGRPLQSVLSTDPRNHVCKARAHFGGWLDAETLVFDITGVSSDATRMDIFRVFLQYAQILKDRHFTKVILASRGTSKFTIDGNYFQELGKEYESQNPMYTIRTFPPHLVAMDGSKPFSDYEGGIIAVLGKELDQFTEFSNQWYLLDFQTTPSEQASSVPNFDPCESARASDPHCGWKPHWEDTGVAVNAIDGARSEFLGMESTDPVGNDYGSLHYARLKICFENGRLCSGNTIGVGVAVYGMLASAGYDSEYSTSVRLKFDDEKPLSQTWGISDDHETLYPHGKELLFLNQLQQHNKLVLEFSYFEKSPRAVTFDLSGLAEKMKSANLGIASENVVKAPAATVLTHGTTQDSVSAPKAIATEAEIAQEEAQADLDEAGPKPTAQARTDAQCPRIEMGTFIFSPGPSGHYWKFCSKGDRPVCFSKETTNLCFK